MFENFKLSYFKSIITVLIIIILLVSLWDLIENFDNNDCDIDDKYYDEVKIKKQQCDNCKLYGNMDNSFINIYKQSFL